MGRRLAAAGLLSDTTRSHYRPLYRLPVFSKFQSRVCEHAERICASIVTLPCYEGLTARDQDRIVEICQRVMAPCA